MATSTLPTGPSSLTAFQDEKLQAYFTALAPEYARLTASSTKHLLTEVLTSVPLGILGGEKVHDNACGPGTATEALIDYCTARNISPIHITATDVNEAMISALAVRAKEEGWTNVSSKVVDSHRLAGYQHDWFKFVFCNFSVFTFAKPLLALIEIHRTLRHTGIAVFTCWKRFGVQEIMDDARTAVKGDGPGEAIKGPGQEFFEEGYLAWLVEEAGWEKGKIKTLDRRIVISDAAEVAAVIEFMAGDQTAFARLDWSDEEKGRWPAAVKDAVDAAKARDGGIVMEAWVVLARKWDALSA